MKGIPGLILVVALMAGGCSAPRPRRAEVLFLGDTVSQHHPDKYASWLAIELFKNGINLTYTTQTTDLNTANLGVYDGLLLYGAPDSLTTEQEKAVKDFVEDGKGLVVLDPASADFAKSLWQPLAGHTGDRSWRDSLDDGRVCYAAHGQDAASWKKLSFLKEVAGGTEWVLGKKVMELVKQLKIPNTPIYPDTIADFTARHVVPKIQPGLTPEESMKLIQVPVDCEVRLFAAEPDITNPIAMAWDERGRLWIVESVDYPNTFVETDGAANDRIKICEDTDGDGKADKFTVFADSLNIPTSMVFANGGVIVSMAPDFVFLKDTNGDDKADVRQTIISGFGKNDTHSGPSNLQYGFDNKIWGVVGFSGFKGTINGTDMQFGQGLYRFNTDGTGFEFLAPTSNNTWGLGFTEDNNVFVSTANDTHAAYFSMPVGYPQMALPGNTVQPIQKIDGHYEVHPLTPNLRQVDVVGGFTAAAGIHFYTARDFPKFYWNRVAFVNEPTVRLVHSAIIEPDGAGFKERDGWNFLASSDEWVGPVHTEVGPDGAVWVADWYNFVIQHNTFVPEQSPTEYILPLTQADQILGQGNALETNLRDLDRGRIYRVVYKKGKKDKPLSLAKDDVPGLLAALKSDNMFWRMTAQRLLVESGDLSALPGLYELIKDERVDEIGLNSPAVHALWTLDGLGVLKGPDEAAFQVVVRALSHPAAGVRKAAIAVLSGHPKAVGALLKSNVINDSNLNVRQQVFLTTAALPASVELGTALYKASLDPVNEKDPWLANALQAAVSAQREGFLAAADRDEAPGARAYLNFSQFLVNMLRQGTHAPAGNPLIPEVAVVAKNKIDLNVVVDKMQYDKKQISAKAGQWVTIDLKNPDGMMHNLVIAKPGTLKKVGAAADELLSDPKAMQKNYVPNIPEVIASTPLITSGKSYRLTFKVPDVVGDYPFLCTFPGHWKGMNGIMHVTK